MDAAFRIYTRNFLPLAKIAAVVWIPLTVLLIGVDLYRYAEVTEGGRLYIVADVIRPLDHDRLVTGAIIVGVTHVIGFLLVVGSSLRAASQAYLGQPLEIGPSLRFALRRVGSMFWLGLLLTLLTTIGYFLFVLPGIYLSIAWILAMPALLLERKSGFKALGRSNDLISDSWWRTFGILIVIGIFTAIFGGVIPGLLQDAIKGTSNDSFTLWVILTDALSGIGFIVTAPIWAAAVTVIYYDQRVRKEGFDVELMVDRIDGPESLAPPSAGEERLISRPPPSQPPPSPPSQPPPSTPA